MVVTVAVVQFADEFGRPHIQTFGQFIANSDKFPTDYSFTPRTEVLARVLALKAWLQRSRQGN